MQAGTLDAAAPEKRNVNMKRDEKHAIFTHELQSALSFTVGFSKKITVNGKIFFVQTRN